MGPSFISFHFVRFISFLRLSAPLLSLRRDGFVFLSFFFACGLRRPRRQRHLARRPLTHLYFIANPLPRKAAFHRLLLLRSSTWRWIGILSASGLRISAFQSSFAAATRSLE